MIIVEKTCGRVLNFDYVISLPLFGNRLYLSVVGDDEDEYVDYRDAKQARRAMDTLIMRLESATQCKGLTVTIPTPAEMDERYPAKGGQ